MWRTIEQNPKYEVSLEGQVRHKKKGNILNIRVKGGYCFVGLSISRRSKKWFSVHRLVALHFIPQVEGKPEVNHKDGNKLNNNQSNLEWVTKKENAQHAIKMGLSVPTMKRVKPVLQLDLNGNLIREWKSCRFAERELNYANGVISKVALGLPKRKQTGGFLWKFKDQVTQAPSQ